MASQSCNSCRGTQFTLTDGFMYCDTCGAMLENFEELEEEDEQRINVGRAKIRVKKKKVDGGKGGEEGEDQEKSGIIRSEEVKMREKSKFFTSQPSTSSQIFIPPKSSPDFLYRSGIRLATFSQLLSRCAKILVNDLNMPPEYNGACLRIFQKYLAHCQIAFCAEELTDDVDLQFSAIVENKDYEREEAERKKRKIEERKSKGLKILGQSTAAWQLLTQGNLDESLAQEEEEEEEESTLIEETQNLTVQEGFLKRISTRISKNAVKRASQILLNLEFLAAILYFAANSIGCKNLLISDIIRWLREDRFGISRKEINLLNRGGFEKYKSKQQQGELQSFLDFHETDLRFPLYEIYRVVVLMEQSLELRLEAGAFEKLSARLIDNLNLPSDLHHRCLILHSLIPCNFDFWHQANSKNGYNLAELADMKPNTTYDAFMNCFGIRESLIYESSEEEVLLTPETKILAYILFALKLSIDLDCEVDENGAENGSELKFDIDTYLHQLEMRLKCWQGHDLSKILRKSAKIPEIAGKLPFGDNFHPQILTWDVGNMRWRRQYGFRQCVPMDLGFEKTHNLPTIFKTRQNAVQNDDFQLPEALLSPLKFQKRVARKEHVEYEDSLQTFNKNFRDLKIVENAGKKEDFAAIFPAAKRYLKYDKPDRTSKCVTRKNRGENSAIHRIYLSLQTIQDIYLCAEDSISPRFDFLLRSFALTIGEDFRAIYTAFCMLETHFLQPEKIHQIKSAFLNSDKLPLNFEKYRKSGKYPCWQVGITPEERISKIEQLDLFRFSEAYCFLEGTSGDLEISSESDDDNDEEAINYPAILRNSRFRGDENRESRRELRLANRAFDFETIFAILSLKNW